MKREFLAAVLLAVTAIGGVYAEETNTPAAKPAAAPMLKFDKTVYDFGTTSLVDTITGTFTFSNAGDADLKIGKPAPSCGCTVASVKPDALKPAETGELVFTVRVGGARGPLEKHITVPSNDPQSPSINLTIKADMKQVIEVLPGVVSLGNILQGAITNVTVHIRRTDGKKLNITNTEAANKFVRTRIQPMEASTDEVANVVIEVEGEGAPRTFSDVVKLYLDDSKTPAVNISLTGRLVGDVAIAPEALYWGISDPEHWATNQTETMTTRRITVTSSKPGQPLEVSNVTSTIKELTVEIVPMEKGKSFSLVAKLSEPPKESTKGTITFSTNMPRQPKIEVPVTITVVKR